MTITATSLEGVDNDQERREERKVLAATLVGTTIEWYDYFIYAQAAGLILVPQFLKPLGESAPALAQVIAFATVGISFLFRPLGAIVAGHLGDRVGRKAMLVLTVILMGAGTALIGVLPGYASIGIAAPILLVVLRIVQGFSAGGEWGGATLMAVEHAPTGKRSLFGAYPQIGVPLGVILATIVMYLLQAVLGLDAFLAWGWRIAFLLSGVLVIIGYLIRRAVGESPVFKQLQQRRQEAAMPLMELFRRDTRNVLWAAGAFIANNACGYILLAFFVSYLAKTLDLALSGILLATVFGASGWLLSTLLGGWLGDKLGRVRTFQVGYLIILLWAIPMWLLIDTGSLFLYAVATLVLSVGLGLTYGPQAALYAETFPAHVRYSGVSISYAIGAVLGGAFAPAISAAIVGATGTSWYIGVYIIVLTLISLYAVTRLGDRSGCDLM